MAPIIIGCLLVACACGLLLAALFESKRPMSQYKPGYAPIGARNEAQMLVWLGAGIITLLAGIDCFATGGQHVEEILKHL